MNDTIDDNDCNSNDSNTSSDDKTYHFRKGSDLDGFESFGALFADGLFTDLAICCAGRVFRCHRVVMAASSAYIKNALSAFNSSDNNNCNTVMILPQEIKGPDMEAILQFIYNGQVEVTRDAIESFLSSAKALHIKGLANIKLVYNNNNHKNHNNNHSNSNNNKNNKNPNSGTNPKTFNNENQNSQNFNHNNNNFSNNENNTNNNSTNNLTNNKKRNGIIGGTANRSPKLKSDLNSSSNLKFAENIPQNQSFHSSPAQTPQENSEPKIISSTARKKQKVSPKALATNGFPNNTKETNGSFVTIDDEEETQHSEILNDTENGIIKSEIKMEDNTDLEKISPIKANGAEPTVPSMPCLIQIDADPTTFPSFCPENNVQKSAKRRRSSSLRLESKNQKNSANKSLVNVNRNGDQIKQMVRTSNRKLGFIQFHKKSTTIWNSSNKWKCEICNKLYGNKQTLKEHMDYFHSNKAEQIFTCSICAKEYTWRKSLMKHYRDIHQISSTSLSQMVSNNQSKTSADSETSVDVPALEWVTQSQDNSSQSK